MLPIFPPPPPEDTAPKEIDRVSLPIIESFRGLSGEKCCELLEALEENNAARLRNICTELRAAFSIRCHYEDQSFHPTLTGIAHEFAAHMCSFCALPIPPERFPTVRVGPPEEFLRLYGTECNKNYNGHPPMNTITINAKHVRSDGYFPQTFYEGLGEELGHFLRAEIRKETRLPPLVHPGKPGWTLSWLVEEFYGYMGRRILREALRGSPLEPICFPSGTCEIPKYLAELRSIRKLRRAPNVEQAVHRERRAQRTILLTHARGYHFAQQVEIDRITNWHAFFALPENDVRRRFFREDQDYNNL